VIVKNEYNHPPAAQQEAISNIPVSVRADVNNVTPTTYRMSKSVTGNAHKPANVNQNQRLPFNSLQTYRAML